jgi:hypothetical protein
MRQAAVCRQHQRSGVACDLGYRSHGDIGGARYILAAHRTRGLGRNNSSVSCVCFSHCDSGTDHDRRACEERGSKGWRGAQENCCRATGCAAPCRRAGSASSGPGLHAAPEDLPTAHLLWWRCPRSLGRRPRHRLSRVPRAVSVAQLPRRHGGLGALRNIAGDFPAMDGEWT